MLSGGVVNKAQPVTPGHRSATLPHNLTHGSTVPTRPSQADKKPALQHNPQISSGEDPHTHLSRKEKHHPLIQRPRSSYLTQPTPLPHLPHLAPHAPATPQHAPRIQPLLHPQQIIVPLAPKRLLPRGLRAIRLVEISARAGTERAQHVRLRRHVLSNTVDERRGGGVGVGGGDDEVHQRVAPGRVQAACFGEVSGGMGGGG